MLEIKIRRDLNLNLVFGNMIACVPVIRGLMVATMFKNFVTCVIDERVMGINVATAQLQVRGNWSRQ